MRNFVQSRRLKALFALVFLSFVGVEVNAQDTVTVSYTHTFTRNQTYCSIDAQFSDWVTFLDSIETLQATGDYRFIEAKYNSNDGSSTKEHVYGGVDIDPFITDLVSLDTTAVGGVGSASYLSGGGDQWWITSGCEVSGAALASCAAGTYPRIAVEINPDVPFGCNPNVESALRPAIGNSSWGGSFGATVPQSVAVAGPAETITFSVRYVDAAAPIPVCFTDTVDVYVDDLGGYTVLLEHIDSASYDEFLNPTLPGSPTVGWGIETYTLSTGLMTCDSIGPRDVLLTIVDSAGNDSTCVTVINVLDTINPHALAADTTVYLDGSGSISIDATYLNAGSYDNCNAGGTIEISDTVFTCTGVFSDTLIMIDGSGNTDTAYAMVTVLDTVAPTANCIASPFELYLDSTGVAVLVADSLDDGSVDNVGCSSLTFSADIDTFRCADALTTEDIGSISVILTVTDSSGNSSTCSAEVAVYDTIAPTSNLFDSLTVYVDQSGVAYIDSALVDSATFDACALDFIDVEILTVTCDSVDSTFYNYVRVVDYYGNEAEEDSVFITVLDTIAPVLDLNDTIFAYLDASGNYTLDSATVDNATADNCTGFTLALNQTTFDCSEAGDTVAVLITATDLDNTPSSSSQNIYVVLQDTVAPVITAVAADTLYLGASGDLAVDSNAFATATDACGVLSISADIDSVDCSDIVGSPLTVTTTATDSNGNTSSGVTALTVLDTLNPTVTTVPNLNVYLDASGNAVLDSNAFDSGSTDNCAIDSFALSISSFDCSYINATNDSVVTVTTYAWDESDNLDSNTSTATIIDTIAPIVTCNDTVVYLNASGYALIDTSFVLDNVIDNCPSTLTYSLSQDTIFCADFDTVMITLSITDAQGNVGTCVSTVAVMDTLAPVAIANNVTIYSDSMGIAKLDSQFVRDVVDNGSFDNCSFELTVSDSIFDCSQEGLNLITLIATDIAGNVGTVDFFVTVDDTIKPQAVGKDVTVALNDNGTVSIDPSLVDSASWDNCMDNMTFDLSQANFDCSNLGANTITFSVQDGNGQADSMDVVITIIDQTLPNAIAQNIVVYLDGAGQAVITANDVDNGSVDNCGLDSMWLSKDTLTCDDLGVTPISLFVTDNNGNQNSAAALVTVMDTIAPVVVTQNVTLYLDSVGNVPTVDAALFENGSSDNCGFTAELLTKIDYDCTHAGDNNVDIKYSDLAGNEVITTAILTIVDSIAPVAIAQDIVVELDANGTVSITPAMINNNSYDDCTALTYTLDITSFDCTNIGTNPIVLTVTDASGNAATASAVVTVSDVTGPLVNLNALTRSLDASGNVTVIAAEFDNGTSDSCGIASTTIDVTTFNCANIGLNTITFTATDVNGNVSIETTTLTIVDDLNPTVIGQDVTAYLNADGNTSVSVSDIDNGSTDNCDITLSLDVMNFDCTMTGVNQVILTGVDGSGNASSDTVTVTVMDTISPMAMAQDISVELDVNGDATITTAMINNNSSDNCAGLTYALDVTSFDCTNIGTNPIVLTVTDASGNTATASAVVTVSDVTGPLVNLNALTRSLDGLGNVVVTAAEFDNGTSDACGIVSTTIDVSAFDCSNIGLNTVTFTATDINGNVSTGTTTLTILDDESPIVKGQDVTAYLNADGNTSVSVSDIDNGSTDNCDLTLSLDLMNFDCTMTGANQVILTGVDGSGNASSDTVTVTVMDTISPMAMAQDISVELDVNGDASITTAMINNNSSDNCAGLTYALDVTSFNCTNIGLNDVVLTVTDASGNASTDSAVVTVLDVTAPVISLNALTRSLDASGDVVVTAAEFDNGTSDACGIASTTIDVSAFDCSNIGLNTVTFTATDVNGNVSTGTTTLTIVDDMLPNVVGQDITVSLNADGNATIVVADVDDNSSDNCGLTLSLDVTNFDCTMTGANEVILTGVDPSGNTSSDTVTVTIVDDVFPTAIAQNVIAELDASGVATITPEMVDNGSYDNCAGITLSLSNTTYACFLAGTVQNVALEVTDASGNSSFASATVTIVDYIAPTVNIQSIVRSLDANGEVAVTAADFNNGTNDNCGVNNISIDLTSFDCSHVGNNTIVFTATDNSGNESTGTTTLTIVDDSLPMAVTQDITVQLNAEGHAEITADDIDNGSSDNCDFTTSIDVSSFDCTEIGANNVVLTVTDANGNVSTSTAVVTIEDNITPIVSTVATKNVYLDANGNASIIAEDLNLSSSDNCPSGGLTYHFSNGFNGQLDCSDIDDNGKNVYVFVKDAAGNISSTQLTVLTIIDETAPVVVTNNITRSLDAAGNVSVTPADFDNGTADACGIDVMTVTPNTFDCSNTGVNTLTFTATDVNGNTTDKTVYLTIEDNSAPTIVGQDITVSLDGSGNAIIDADMVDNGTSDNCDFDISINATDFDCSDLGANTVTLTATDVNGNVSTVDVTVTVEDNTNPTAIAQDITVQLDASGAATITTGQINNGSLDNCSSQALTYVLDITSFDCSNVGANTVTLTATDASGNASTATAVVTVEDNMLPVVASQNVALVLDGNGDASIDVAGFAHGATDNCGIASFTLSNTDFDCSNIGLNTIELEVTDNNGNVSTADVFVTITDETAPTTVTLPFGPFTEMIIGECQASGFEYDLPTFDDNCEVVSVALVEGLPSGAIFPIDTTTITYLATDASGNSTSVTVSVIVKAQGMPTDLPVSSQMCPDGDNISLGSEAQFTGNGVVGTEFNPSVAGEGVHELSWTYTDTYGCVTTGSVTMTVYPTATIPVVSQTGSTVLTASNNGYDTYQWYMNGDMLPGQTSQTLSINSTGSYQVRGYTINGCSSLSIALTIGNGEYDVEGKGFDIAETTLYPNPTTGKVYVDLGETLEKVSIEVFDARGAKVKTFNFENMTSTTVEIELSELPSAMYHVIISSDVQVTTKKIVINK